MTLGKKGAVVAGGLTLLIATTWQLVPSRGQPASTAPARFGFAVVESFDAKYLGDTPGHLGRGRIEHGKLTQMYRNPNYTGITPEFWGSCDAVADREEWVVWGTPNCGKGQPGQIGRVGHGASPGRFRGVQVGVR